MSDRKSAEGKQDYHVAAAVAACAAAAATAAAAAVGFYTQRRC